MHRAKVEQFIEELKSIDDAQLMLLYDEQLRGYQDEVERAKSHGQGQGGGCRVSISTFSVMSPSSVG